MLKAVEGIIVSVTDYGETSKIINIITEDGIIGGLAKGAKSMKSPLRSFTSKLTYGKFQLYYKEEGLSTIKDIDVINSLTNTKKDILLISYLSYLTDLTQQIMKQNTDSDLYHLYISTILKLEQGLNPLILCNIFELKVLDYLGVGINLNACAKCGKTNGIVTINADSGGYICQACHQGEAIYDEKTIKLLRMYYLVDINSISDLKISETSINNINRFINQYYDRYTGLYLKTKKFLEEMRGNIN